MFFYLSHCYLNCINWYLFLNSLHWTASLNFAADYYLKSIHVWKVKKKTNVLELRVTSVNCNLIKVSVTNTSCSLYDNLGRIDRIGTRNIKLSKLLLMLLPFSHVAVIENTQTVRKISHVSGVSHKHELHLFKTKRLN